MRLCRLQRIWPFRPTNTSLFNKGSNIRCKFFKKEGFRRYNQKSLPSVEFYHSNWTYWIASLVRFYLGVVSIDGQNQDLFLKNFNYLWFFVSLFQQFVHGDARNTSGQSSWFHNYFLGLLCSTLLLFSLLSENRTPAECSRIPFRFEMSFTLFGQEEGNFSISPRVLLTLASRYFQLTESASLLLHHYYDWKSRNSLKTKRQLRKVGQKYFTATYNRVSWGTIELVVEKTTKS